MALWDAFLTERDRRVFEASGYGAAAGFGRRPVLLVIDVNYAFCGDKCEPIEQSIVRWRNSCGASAWDALPHIARLLRAARAKQLPVIYTTGEPASPDPFLRGRWVDKNPSGLTDHLVTTGNVIIPDIAPMAGEIVIPKAKPSAFFGTMLAGYLADLGADSVIACGTTTSGCVRATVLDGFSFNYRMSVVIEATFDRFESSHAMCLFDLNAKYADVVHVDATVTYIESLPGSLFLADMPSLADRPAPTLVD